MTNDPYIRPTEIVDIPDDLAAYSCPNGHDLRGKEIPKEYRDKGWYGNATHYSRKIGIEVPGVYDGVSYWTCPDCGVYWHRFRKGSHIRKRLERWLSA